MILSVYVLWGPDGESTHSTGKDTTAFKKKIPSPSAPNVHHLHITKFVIPRGPLVPLPSKRALKHYYPTTIHSMQENLLHIRRPRKRYSISIWPQNCLAVIQRSLPWSSSTIIVKWHIGQTFRLVTSRASSTTWELYRNHDSEFKGATPVFSHLFVDEVAR